MTQHNFLPGDLLIAQSSARVWLSTSPLDMSIAALLKVDELVFMITDDSSSSANSLGHYVFVMTSQKTLGWVSSDRFGLIKP
jgi:hypothetical protein